MPNLLAFLIAWYNWPFSLLLVLAVGLVVLQFVGLGGDHDADSDADVDADGDVNADSDADTDGDVDTPDGALGLLAFLGVGKAPIAVILALLFGATSVIGWLINAGLVSAGIAIGGLALAAIFVAALVVATLITGRVSRLIGRALPPVSTTAVTEQSLVGRTGKIVSAKLDAQYGMVRVRDRAGTMINVFAVTDDTTASDATTSLEKDSIVMLTSYDAATKRYNAKRIENK